MNASRRRCRQDRNFTPLMTCYLTDETDPDDVERGFRDGCFHRRKALSGERDHEFGGGRFRYSQYHARAGAHGEVGMPFLMHGEEVGPEIDIFDREAAFIGRRLSKWVKEFPGLRMNA